MSVTPIPFAGLPETPWANGAGRKADIAGGEGWALAFAWLDGPAPFSNYSGLQRTITLVEGDGFALDFADHPSLLVAEPGKPADFDGGWPATCRLLGGPCFVLNAYSQQGLVRQSVQVMAPRAAGPLSQGDSLGTFMVVLRGQVWLGGVAAGPRDTLRLAAPAAASGGADALVAVVRFARA
jgi:environmental stress-induced protein Ves